MFVQLLLTVLARFLSFVASLPTDLVSESVQERDSSRKYLSLPVNVNRNKINVNSTGIQNFKRGNPIASPIKHAGISYTIELLFGSNKQQITVQVDTGSADLWVVDASTPCATVPACNASGYYDPSQSTTSRLLGEAFSITYGGLFNEINGNFYLDDVTFPNGPTVRQVQFADDNNTAADSGILGIGLNNTEAPIFEGQTNTVYANFPWVLKDQGLIAKAAYSLFLNSEEATSGTLIFGGIDKAKIDGSLVKLPGALNNRLGVQGDSVIIDGTATTIGLAIVLDCGYTYSQFHWEAVQAIGAAMSGSQTQPNIFPYLVDCTQPDKYFTFSLGNGKQTIQVPYSSFVQPGGQPGGQCTITLMYSTGGINSMPNFGDDVLRHLYIVYDIEDNDISIGQAKYTTDSDITPIL